MCSLLVEQLSLFSASWWLSWFPFWRNSEKSADYVYGCRVYGCDFKSWSHSLLTTWPGISYSPCPHQGFLYLHYSGQTAAVINASQNPCVFTWSMSTFALGMSKAGQSPPGQPCSTWRLRDSDSFHQRRLPSIMRTSCTCFNCPDWKGYTGLLIFCRLEWLQWHQRGSKRSWKVLLSVRNYRRFGFQED